MNSSKPAKVSTTRQECKPAGGFARSSAADRFLRLARAYLLQPSRYYPGGAAENRLLDQLGELGPALTDEEYEAITTELEKLRPQVNALEAQRRPHEFLYSYATKGLRCERCGQPAPAGVSVLEDSVPLPAWRVGCKPAPQSTFSPAPDRSPNL